MSLVSIFFPVLRQSVTFFAIFCRQSLNPTQTLFRWSEGATPSTRKGVKKEGIFRILCSVTRKLRITFSVFQGNQTPGQVKGRLKHWSINVYSRCLLFFLKIKQSVAWKIFFLRQQAYARDDTTEAKRFCWEFYIDFPDYPVFLRNHFLESCQLLPGEIKRFSDYQKI